MTDKGDHLHKMDHVFKRYNRPTPDHLKVVVAGGNAENVTAFLHKLLNLNDKPAK